MKANISVGFVEAIKRGLRLFKIVLLCLMASPCFTFVMAQNPQSKPGETEQEKRGLGVRPTSKSQSGAAAASRPKPDLVLQTGHAGTVLDVAFTSDSRRLLSGGDKIRVWDVATGRQIRTFGHEMGATNLEISPDGRLMASSGSDKKIRFWDTKNWKEVKSLAYPDIPKDFRADDLRFSPDGRVVIAFMQGGDALLWETASGKYLGFINDKARGGVAFSPDGRWMVTVTDYNKEAVLFDVAAAREASSYSLEERLLVMSRDYKLAKLDESDPRNILVSSSAIGNQKLTGHTGLVKAIAFSPDGSKLASGSFDKTVKIWEVASGRELRTLSGHTSSVTAVGFSFDGKLMASADTNATKLWDVSSGREVASLDTSGDRWNEARFLSFTPDKRWVIRGTTTKVIFWEQATGKKTTADILEVTRRPYYYASPDGQWQATPMGGKIALSNPTTRESKNLEGYPPGYQEVSFSRDGRWLALSSDQGIISNSGDGSVRIWETATGQMVQRVELRGAKDIAFSPDGKSLAVDARVLDVMGGRKSLTVNPTKATEINDITFSPDGKQFATSNDKAINFWEAGTGREVQMMKPTFMLTSYAISSDWRLLAMAELGHFEPQNKITIWDAQSGVKLRELPAHYYKEGVVAFSPDGRTLAAGGNSEAIKLWDAVTGNEIRSIAVNHGMFGSQLAFSPDGRVLASAGNDGVVRLWDVATGRELRALTDHAGTINGLAFHPKGQILASSSSDGSVILWEIATGQQIALLTAIQESNDWLVVTPDGLFDGSPQGMAKLVAWRFANDEVVPAEVFFSEFYYPGLLAEILAGRRPKAARNILDIDRRQPQIALKLADPQPSDMRSISSRNVNLRIEVTEALADADHPTGSGARDVRLFRNGSLVKVWRGDVASGKAVLEASVPIIAGENRLTAYAFNRDNVKSLDATLIVKGSESLKRQGTAHVLVVGINQYANPDYNLKYAVADVEAFAEEFQRQQSRLSNYASVEVIALTDRDATKANILEALKRLAGTADEATRAQLPAALQKIKPAQPEDAVIVYFAGHGTAQQSRFYLIPHDLGYSGSRDELNESSLNAILSHSISDLELERAFEGVDSAHLLLVIDACNSGQALEAEEKRRGPMNSKGLAQLAYEKGMYILTAAQSYQAALEAAQLGHGYLTYALVEEGLKTPAADSQPNDGKVVAREWLDYATMRVPQMQLAKMQEARGLKIKIAFVKGEESLDEVEKKSLQRPRVFYRRELEALPLIISRQ